MFSKSTPESLPNCTVPLLFETGVEETPYGHAGTGFLATLDGEVFLATASHCIEEGQHNSVVLPISESTNDVAKFRSFFSKVIDVASPDNGPMDIAFFSMDLNEKNTVLLKERAIHLPLSFDFEAVVRKARIGNMRVPVLVVGYPKNGTATQIDFENKRFVTQGARLFADYVDTWPGADCHRIRFREPCPISDLNGMSGSPVFGYTKYDGKTVYFLGGMLFLGVFPMANFVSVRTIRAAMMEGIRKERVAQGRVEK